MDEQESNLWRRVVETAQRWDFWKKRHEDEGPAVEWLTPVEPPPAWTATPERVSELTRIMEEEEVALKAYLEALRGWTQYSTKKEKARP